MKLSSIKIDATRLEQGDWVGDIPEMPGVRFKVRGLGNSDYRRLQAKLISDIPRNERLNGLSLEHQDRVQAECLKKTVLLDWEGFDEEDGRPMPFSLERAGEILLNPDLIIFKNGVLWAAGRLSEDREETTKELAGN